ncbi:unnamed protein product [Rotaria sordida]|uniref:Transposase Synechocystis PCC 6803 domain-containing protein n=1 Tax=Rotaria sordida TaxID=392033 RepID=A0A815SGW4_9BILA|nr:unnamed protein product [Rotaria sordida]CAF1490490.1 unnamed protein product [Rotaria sordida]CAF3686358.1 unnamed protein product [Rotaria sordida]CAF3757211.1 unnamed protein product [Rotaria sordida]
MQEGFKRSTIYNIIKRYDIYLIFEDRPRSGRPTHSDKKNLKRLQYTTENRVGVSQRELARKFGVAQSTIHYNLKRIDLKYSKRQKAPKYAKRQLEEIPKKCRKIRRQMTTKRPWTYVMKHIQSSQVPSIHTVTSNIFVINSSLETKPNDYKEEKGR